MMQDFQKIASEAIQQCRQYEARIQELQGQLQMAKKASAVDAELLQKSVDALKKSGSITEEQAQETAQLLATNPNASLRAINALCEHYTDAAPIHKKESVDIQGGQVVRNKLEKQASHVEDTDEAYASVAKVLGLKL